MIKLNTIDRQAFAKKILDNPNEDLVLIETIEDYLKKKRGYVTKPPEKNESVILLLSGGIDSIVAWYVLMAYYKAKVYPITRIMGKLDPTLHVVIKFSNIYRKKFPKLFQEHILYMKTKNISSFPNQYIPHILSPEKILEIMIQ
jgi:tRNA(Ile)-lysidine synthase TilS/MesJ